MVDGSRQRRNILLYALISFGSTVLLEVLLEGATRGTVGKNQSLVVALFLTLGEFLGCCILSKAFGGELFDPNTKGTSLKFWTPYVKMSFLLLLGSGLPNLAVQWVQFPLKVTIKSSKLMLTMAVAAAMGNCRQYSASEYFVSFLLVVGNLSFSFGSGNTDAPTYLAVLGVVLLLAASLGDVFAVNAQQRMMQKEKVAPMSVMLRQNFSGLWACLFMFVTCVTCSSQSLTNDWPQLLQCTFYVGLCTAMSAWANTHLVNEAGSVVQAQISSLRKLCTVVLSYALFPKPLGYFRGGCIGLVVVSLVLLHVLARKKAKDKSPALAAKTQVNIVALNKPESSHALEDQDLEAAQEDQDMHFQTKPAKKIPEFPMVQPPMEEAKPLSRSNSPDSDISTASGEPSRSTSPTLSAWKLEGVRPLVSCQA